MDIDKENLDRNETITNILADGVYSFLRKKGHLRKTSNKTTKIKKTIENARKLQAKITEEKALYEETASSWLVARVVIGLGSKRSFKKNEKMRICN